MLQQEEVLLIVFVIGTNLLVLAFAILFFVVFQKRKNALILQKLKAEKQFEEVLHNAKFEIQEQTLQHVSWELHDNIGQLLAAAVMHINMFQASAAQSSEVSAIKKLIQDSLQEIRNLSKTLNNEVIQNIGLQESIATELLRFEKLNFLKTKFHVLDRPLSINPKDEIILFRIIQEFFSNTIKHAQASMLQVRLEHKANHLNITIQDNGKGFDPESVKKNSGLLNMKSRAQLIHTDFEIQSKPNQGVLVTMRYPLENNS